MGVLQKKGRTTRKKALAYRGKGGQNTDIAFLALRLGVVLHLLNRGYLQSCATKEAPRKIHPREIHLPKFTFLTRPQLEPFFVLKFLRSRGLSSTVSKGRSDLKVLFEQKMAPLMPLMAVNGGHGGTKKGPNWGHVTFQNSTSRAKQITLCLCREPKTDGTLQSCLVLGVIPRASGGTPNCLARRSTISDR